MNVLVTGGAGFIGSTLVDRLLVSGHHVEVVDDFSTGQLANLADARAEGSGRLKLHQVDVCDTSVVDLIRRREPDVVFHLAAATGRDGGDPGRRAAVDLVGTVNVFEGARQAGCRKVVVAQSARARTAPSVRAATRWAATYVVERYREAHGLEHTTVVLPVVYGPRQLEGCESSVVVAFARRLLDGAPCVLHGTGRQTRDFLFVDDAVDALTKAMAKGDGLTIDVGTGTQISVAQLHAALVAVVGGDGRRTDTVPGARREDEPDAVVVDPGRARIYLGWESWTPLAEGLADTVLAQDPR